MKTKFSTLIGAILAIMAFSAFDVATSDTYFNANDSLQSNQDWSQCVLKASSEWGGKCLNYGFSEDKYTVHLTNTCSEKIDLMSCVQRENGQWRCFYRMDMTNKDTLHAYACKGVGKYLKWVRQAGDHSIKFPTLEEVNDMY